MAFKDSSWLQADAVTLVTVSLADPDGVRDTAYTTDPGASPTLRFCDRAEPYTYDSDIYYPGILSWDGRMAGSAFSGRKSDADGTLILANSRYVWQQKGAAAPTETAQYQVKLAAMMRSYLWAGALVVVTVIAELPSGAQVYQQVFYGRIHDISLGIESIQLQCVEDKEYNRRKPDADGPANATSSTRWMVNVTDYPNAPPDQIGKTMPLVYSDQTGLLESGRCLAVSPKNLTGLWPGIISDVKYDVTNDRTAILQAFHTGPVAIATANCQPYVYVPELDTVAPIYSAGSSGVSPDGYHYEYGMRSDSYGKLYVNPDKFYSKTAGVTDVYKAFDGNYLTYAVLANTGSDVNFQLKMPEGMNPGLLVDIVPFLYLSTGTGVGGTDADVNGTFGLWDITGAAYLGTSKNITKANVRDGGFIDGTTLAVSTSTGTSLNPLRDYRWAWVSGSDEHALSFRVNISSSGATANVIACGIKAHFQPSGFQAKGFGSSHSYTRRMK